jgi:subtilase family serine protease
MMDAPVATVDADDTIAERDETDNSFTVACPGP